MYRLLFIARQNLKKKKQDAVVLVLLTALSVLLLHIGISVLTQIGSVADRAYEAANTADFYYAGRYPDPERVIKILRGQEETAEAEASQVLLLPGAEYKGAGDAEVKKFTFMLGNAEEERQICRVYPEVPKDLKEDEIILPYYLKAASSYREGDRFELTIGKQTYRFFVRGFAEDPLFATSVNMSMYKCYVTRECFLKIRKQAELSKEGAYWEYKVKLKPGESPSDFEEKITPVLISEIPELSGGLGFNWDSMRSADVMMSGIGMGIMLVFAALLLVIAVLIIRFCIRNFIEMNLKNIGVLKASGYTSVQLIVSALMEMGLLACIGIFLGLLGGIFCGGVVGGLEASLMGLPWRQEFCITAAFASGGSVLAVVLMVTFTGSLRYQRIMVLDALRGGIVGHNFHKNYFPLDKTRQPLIAALGAKAVFGAGLKNMGIFSIVAILSLSCCIGFDMYENFVGNSDYLLKLVGLETGDVTVTGKNLSEVKEELSGFPETEKMNAYISGSIKVTNEDNSISVNCDFWEEPEKLENEILLEGRLPEYENEIVMTSVVCKQIGAGLGDVVYVEGTGSRKDFMIVGIDQKINGMGRKALMNLKAAERLNGSMDIMQLFIYAADGSTADGIIKHVKQAFPELKAVDSASAIGDMLFGIMLVMKLLCTLFVIITVVTVFLVVQLLVKSKIIRERRNYGVYKALGFTTGELMGQTVLSVLPVIAAGAVFGALLSLPVSNPFAGLCMSSVGIVKCEMNVGLSWRFVTVLLVILVAAVTMAPNIFKIRRIDPVQMLMED